MSGMFATFALGQLQQILLIPEDEETFEKDSSAVTEIEKENLKVYGNTLGLFLIISYAGCVPFYYLAGKHYTKFMEAIAFEKEMTEKAEEEALDSIAETDSMAEVESIQ